MTWPFSSLPYHLGGHNIFEVCAPKSDRLFINIINIVIAVEEEVIVVVTEVV